jgi:galactan 5-O-arabinofuranosyltransferase
VKTGVAFGAAFGLLCVSYSGWFEWMAPGLVVATAVVFPWRTAPRNGFGLLATTLAAFLAISGFYLAGALFDPDAKLVDNYVYFDVGVDPMYIAMWRNDLPGEFGGVWPPIGELGGVGLFTLILAAGMAVAVAFRRRSTLVITLVLLTLGAWLLRFWYAHSLSATGLVQLYPRTTALILYCMIVLTGCGVCWGLQRLRDDHPFRGTSGLVGGLVGLLFVLASAGSSISDRYMPSGQQPYGVGWFAWSAHQAQLATEHKPNPLHVMRWTRRGSIPLQTPTGGSATPR